MKPMHVLLTFIGFTNFLDASSLSFSFFTNADVATIKMRHQNKICETNGSKILGARFPTGMLQNTNTKC